MDTLITLAIESSARMTQDLIARSERAVHAVVTIGGCARIPLVAEVLERWLGRPSAPVLRGSFPQLPVLA